MLYALGKPCRDKGQRYDRDNSRQDIRTISQPYTKRIKDPYRCIISHCSYITDPIMARVNKKTFKLILDRIVDGESLAQICKDDGLPSDRTVLRHVQDSEEDFEAYMKARALQAEKIHDTMMDMWNESYPIDVKEKHTEILRRDKTSYWLDKRRTQLQPRGSLRNKVEDKNKESGEITIRWGDDNG